MVIVRLHFRVKVSLVKQHLHLKICTAQIGINLSHLPIFFFSINHFHIATSYLFFLYCLLPYNTLPSMFIKVEPGMKVESSDEEMPLASPTHDENLSENQQLALRVQRKEELE